MDRSEVNLDGGNRRAAFRALNHANISPSFLHAGGDVVEGGRKIPDAFSTGCLSDWALAHAYFHSCANRRRFSVLPVVL